MNKLFKLVHYFILFFQANEIRQYLISAGADLNSTSKENMLEELSALLEACDNWLKSAADAGKISF